MGGWVRARFPVLRVLGGALFILAGVFAYYGVTFGSSIALVFLVGGAAVILLALFGHRPRYGDIAFFVLGMLVLSGVAVGYNPGSPSTSYSATRGQLHSGAISLDVHAGAGSVDVGFTNRPDVAYIVNFTRPVPFFTLWSSGGDTVTNSTVGGVFNLDVQSGASSVTVLLGRGYVIDLRVSADTGSVFLTATGNENLVNVTLSTSTGSVSAVVDSHVIQGLDLHTSTGSVSLVSDHLGADGKSVPVTLSTSTGSVSLRASVQSGDAVSLSASTSLGSINHDLRGFVVTQDTRTNLAASAGNPTTAEGSFVVSATSNLGSVNVTVNFISG